MKGSRITKICLNCDSEFSIPQCRDWREHCCSSQCKKEYKQKLLDEDKDHRKRFCQGCGEVFYPRWTQINDGQGKYCSLDCSLPSLWAAANQPEVHKKRGESRKRSIALGLVDTPAGPKNPNWMGGREAYKRRQIESGKAAERQRKYRKANPEKVREWRHHRQSKKYSRLPRGSVKKIYDYQKGKCAVCKRKVGSDYHIDHILPLAKGGTHEKHNIQILCPSCNVRKSDKDPVEYMQAKGMLI